MLRHFLLPLALAIWVLQHIGLPNFLPGPNRVSGRSCPSIPRIRPAETLLIPAPLHLPEIRFSSVLSFSENPVFSTRERGKGPLHFLMNVVIMILSSPTSQDCFTVPTTHLKPMEKRERLLRRSVNRMRSGWKILRFSWPLKSASKANPGRNGKRI